MSYFELRQRCGTSCECSAAVSSSLRVAEVAFVSRSNFARIRSNGKRKSHFPASFVPATRSKLVIMLKVRPRPLRRRAEARELIDDLACALLQIWTMKKNEDAAAKKKPKISAAQIRVQKGEHSPAFPSISRHFLP